MQLRNSEWKFRSVALILYHEFALDSPFSRAPRLRVLSLARFTRMASALTYVVCHVCVLDSRDLAA